MPIYEYRCKRCGSQFEVIQRISEAPLKKCRDCGSPLEQLVSRSSFQLKGSGWYVTDYARKSSGGGSESGKSDAGKSGKDTPSKDAGKPASDKGSSGGSSGKASGE